MVANLRAFTVGIAALGLTLLAPTSLLAQAAGTVTGTVREVGTNRPLPNARVTVVGTSITAPARDDGVFTLRGVPTGTIEVRAAAIGHAAARRSVSVAAGGTATVDFALAVAPVQLEEVVTTATGLERRLEVGNDIPRIDAENLVATRPIANMADLLTGRAAGVQVIPGTITGTQSRIRVRGASSLSLSNDPIYLIDGIRMESASGSSVIGVGGAIPSRIGDIDPEQIESIEVVKGPSAATLYGTDAANGVVVITTKRGRAGRAKWNVYVERGTLRDKNTYPTAYTLWGHAPATPTTARQCRTAELSLGTCIQDSLTTFNLWEDPETTPLATGNRQQYGAQVSGGSDLLRYFVSGEYEEEINVLKVPQFDIERLNQTQGGIPFIHLRPNALERSSFRANLNATLSPTADLAVSTAFIELSQRRPQTDNNTTGLLSSAYGGPGFKNNGVSSLGFPLMGYRVFTPGDVFQDVVTQDIARFIGSLSPNWRPLSWLSSRGNFGIDFTSRVDSELCKRGNCSDFGTSREGFRFQYRTNFYQYTADMTGMATFRLHPAVNSKTSVGYQYFRRTFHRNGAEAENLPPGTQTVTAGAVKGADELTTYNITAGGFIQEEVSFNDRLFVTGAVRADKNTAFGQDFETVYYPKASLSWIASEEPFFPRAGFLSELRLRLAYGASGVSPGANDALQFFLPRVANLADVGTAGIQFSSLGNPDLQPERATELEGGFDVSVLDNRLSLGLTRYRKKTTDALIEVRIAGSVGAGFTSGGTPTRVENVGSTLNRGWETAVRAQLIQTSRIGVDLGFTLSTNDNEILKLSDTLPIVVSRHYQHRIGYPLWGFWHNPIKSFSDANGDGMITIGEVVVGDTLEYRGPSIPTTEWAFNPGVDLFDRMVRLTASIDHKGGHRLVNGTERIRCQNRNNCRGRNDPSASLFEQARVIAMLDHPTRTEDGFIEKADYTKLREIALTFTAPETWFRNRLGGQRTSITLAARNIKTWTDYTGIDPESAYFEGGGGNDIQTDFQTQPPPRYYTLRFNLGF